MPHFNRLKLGAHFPQEIKKKKKKGIKTKFLAKSLPHLHEL